MIRTLVMGAVLGLVCGIIFNALYFGAGQLTTPMAYVHAVSGTLLGIMISWIVYLQRKVKKEK
jgi:prepilin signal peptidase PulO-like enzyme (type II secretory pathway)